MLDCTVGGERSFLGGEGSTRGAMSYDGGRSCCDSMVGELRSSRLATLELTIQHGGERTIGGPGYAACTPVRRNRRGAATGGGYMSTAGDRRGVVLSAVQERDRATHGAGMDGGMGDGAEHEPRLLASVM
jgi:hypothetical protein